MTIYRYSDVETVTLYVGKAKNVFNVHADILCQYSAVFRAAFGPHFREGSERAMTLPDEEVWIFEYFVDWIYTQHYKIKICEEDNKQAQELDISLRLYVIAEKYDVPTLKKIICKDLLAIAELAKSTPSMHSVIYAYAHTPRNSRIRRLLATWYSTIPLGWFQKEEIRTWLFENSQFAVDLTSALAKRLSITGSASWYSLSNYINETEP